MMVNVERKQTRLFASESNTRLPGIPSLTLEALTILADSPPPSTLFEHATREVTLHEDAFRNITCIDYKGFRVWPVFLDAGWRGVPGGVYDTESVAKEFPDYMANHSASTARSAVAEAVRNIAQHGKKIDRFPNNGNLCFAPGAIFFKEFPLSDSTGLNHRFLMCLISDEGMGIEDPALSLVAGVGSWAGEDHKGLGYELSDSVVMMIRARSGRWFLFDGLHHRPDEASRSKHRVEDVTRVQALAELPLPVGYPGCKKIFIFQHQESQAEKVFEHFVREAGRLTQHTSS